MNRHNVFFIDFSEIPRDCMDYREYIDRIQNGINNDLAQAYPDFEIHTEDAVWDILSDIFHKTGHRFIFVMDEWDAPFHMPFITEEARRKYLLFLKTLLTIVCALTDDELANYWTSSGPYDEIFYYIRNNIEAVRDDLVFMVAGEGVQAEVRNYAAVSMELNTRDEIYSAMVVYGLLTYIDGKVYIPNREIMEQFRNLLMSRKSL